MIELAACGYDLVLIVKEGIRKKRKLDMGEKRTGVDCTICFRFHIVLVRTNPSQHFASFA